MQLRSWKRMRKMLMITMLVVTSCRQCQLLGCYLDTTQAAVAAGLLDDPGREQKGQRYPDIAQLKLLHVT